MTTDVREIVAQLRSVDVSWSETGELCAEAADLIAALAAECDAAEACADRLLQMIEVSVRRYTDELERTECILPMRLEIKRLREQVTDLMDELAYHGIYPSDLMGGEGQ
jgi:hypothetical protein